MSQPEQEVYLIADIHRLVIQSLIRDFNDAKITLKCIDPDPEQVKYIPDGPVNVILSITESASIGVLRMLHQKVLKTGTHLFIVGKKSGLSIDEENLLKKTPAAIFENYPIDMEKFQKMLEFNNRLKKRILIVDDEPMMLKSIKSWLQDEYETYMVNSGMCALDFLERHPVDLVLLDYEMPGLSGPDTLNRIRIQTETKNLAVIFLTAKDDKSCVMKAVKQKPDGYLLKKQTPEENKKNINDFFKRFVVRV